MGLLKCDHFKFSGKHCFACLSFGVITAEPGCSSTELTVQFSSRPLDGPFNPEISPPPTHLSPLSSSLPTKWMTAFSNTRVRHDSEVHMLCHLCSTCFDASAAREPESDHACSSTSIQLMLQPDIVSKLQG